MKESNMSFEEAMDRLQSIVQDLESNEKPLDETIALFEEGLQLVKNCDTKLKQYETQINTLIAQNGDDNGEN